MNSQANSTPKPMDHNSSVTLFEHTASHALKFITCGSVDDGKSTLIGRLLVDSKAVLQDHLAGIKTHGEMDLAMLTDGLSAEREQGITIDVAYRYFTTEHRKFIIGDTPGHEQYTRNMVTAASGADAAVVLVDATKLAWQDPQLELLQQTRRHSILLKLLRVPHVIFAINKLDAVYAENLGETQSAATAFKNISTALTNFTNELGIKVTALIPVSALKGWNVVSARAGWCSYFGPPLIEVLERLESPKSAQTPTHDSSSDASLDKDLPVAAFAMNVQWVEKFHDSSITAHGRRIFWGRVATGMARVGQKIRIHPGTQEAVIAQVLSATRQNAQVPAGLSCGIILDREVDVSRGDTLMDEQLPLNSTVQIHATIAWMDDETLQAGRTYHALHAHKWVKCKVQQIISKIDINTLEEKPSTELTPNEIGHVVLLMQQELPTLKYSQSSTLGAMILVDTASHKTSAAVMID
jgi:sulfate adenylyltransferase subunit 1